jgi:hypothetical protein
LDDIEPELDIDSWTKEERERADPAGVFLEIETESGIA